MWVDEIVEETRRAREEYAAKFNFDLEAIWEDLKRQEAQGGREVISAPARNRTPANEKSLPGGDSSPKP